MFSVCQYDVRGRRHDYDVSGEVFCICQSDVTGRPVRILTVQARIGEANIIKMDASSWLHLSLRLFMRKCISNTHCLYGVLCIRKKEKKKKKKRERKEIMHLALYEYICFCIY